MPYGIVEKDVELSDQMGCAGRLVIVILRNILYRRIMFGGIDTEVDVGVDVLHYLSVYDWLGIVVPYRRKAGMSTHRSFSFF